MPEARICTRISSACGCARSSVCNSNGADRAGTTAAVIFILASLSDAVYQPQPVRDDQDTATPDARKGSGAWRPSRSSLGRLSTPAQQPFLQPPSEREEHEHKQYDQQQQCQGERCVKGALGEGQ